MVNAFDATLFDPINGMAGRVWVLDGIMKQISSNHLFKGIPLMMLFWAVWARVSAAHAQLMATLVVAVTAIGVGRLLANTLPYRPRPIHSDYENVRNVFESERMPLVGWSSFPSDHAVLFFSVAVALFLAHRVLGAIALLFALFAVCLPRIYLGLHWPTDILAGALIGTVLTLTAVPLMADWLKRTGAVELAHRHPAITYPLMFFVTTQVAILFDPFRSAAQAAMQAVGH